LFYSCINFNLRKYSQSTSSVWINYLFIYLLKYIFYSYLCTFLAGMDPAWSGRGGALVPTAELCRSCVQPAHQLLYLNCKIVVHSSLMFLLKLLYLILSFLLDHKKLHPPAPPLARAWKNPSLILIRMSVHDRLF
jgi:hypothetical protein